MRRARVTGDELAGARHLVLKAIEHALREARGGADALADTIEAVAERRGIPGRSRVIDRP